MGIYMTKFDVYLYGMILATNSFLLKNEYPEADTYGEIKEKYKLPGGETGTCATILESLGCTVKIDGNHMGKNVFPTIQKFYRDKNVDISSLTFDDNYDGLEDYVIIDKYTRTPFGTFQSYYSDPVKRWNKPSLTDIKKAEIVGLDPYFGEESEMAAELCKNENKKYVTIDCRYDSIIHKNSSVNILSGEFFSSVYPDIKDYEQLFYKYIENSDGLVIFTKGSKEFIYGRKTTGIKTYVPYKVNTVSTLGAGDTFKAGCVYALLKNMTDEETVSFASACAAVACTRFPLPLNPPKLDDVTQLQKSRT